jgi:hypothetical protein
MSLKSLLNDLIPAGLKQGIGNLKRSRERRLVSQLPIQEAFDEVYKKGLWGRGDANSGPGSAGDFADRYVAFVQDYAAKHKLRTVVDGGCGDFLVGSRLAPSFDRYTALDVSPFIIDINKRRYAQNPTLQHVNFDVADMTAAIFPPADLVLIRQVLQHLTNAQIEKVLQNLEASTWRRALITEDVCDPANDPAPNIDLPTHSVRTRTPLRSGVYIDQAPFHRAATRLTFFPRAEADKESRSGLLIFELSRDSAL